MAVKAANNKSNRKKKGKGMLLIRKKAIRGAGEDKQELKENEGGVGHLAIP